jgi:DNA-binding response OmpR family regulator
MARILVIEDDRQVRMLLKKILTREGYDVIEAEDGQHGLRQFRENGADLVITDIIMPEKEGLETIQELKQDSDVSIIAISGGGRISPDDYLKLAAKFGASCTLSKPIEKQVLLDTVRNLIDG